MPLWIFHKHWLSRESVKTTRQILGAEMTWVWQLNCFLYLPGMLLRLQVIALTLSRSTYVCLEWEVYQSPCSSTCININYPLAVVTTPARQLTTISSRVVRVAYPLLLRFCATSSCQIMWVEFENCAIWLDGVVQALATGETCRCFIIAWVRIDYIKWYVAVQAIMTSYILEWKRCDFSSPVSPPRNLKPWAPLLHR